MQYSFGISKMEHNSIRITFDDNDDLKEYFNDKETADQCVLTVNFLITDKDATGVSLRAIEVLETEDYELEEEPEPEEKPSKKTKKSKRNTSSPTPGALESSDQPSLLSQFG